MCASSEGSRCSPLVFCATQPNYHWRIPFLLFLANKHKEEPRPIERCTWACGHVGLRCCCSFQSFDYQFHITLSVHICGVAPHNSGQMVWTCGSVGVWVMARAKEGQMHSLAPIWRRRYTTGTPRLIHRRPPSQTTIAGHVELLHSSLLGR